MHYSVGISSQPRAARIGLPRGVKTIAVQTNTGTATILPICVNGPGWLQSEVALGSLTGATCTTAANCLLTTTAWCDRIFLRVTACSSCRVTGWLRNDPY